MAIWENLTLFKKMKLLLYVYSFFAPKGAPLMGEDYWKNEKGMNLL